MLLDDETIQTAPKERREAPPRCRANSVRGSTEQANASYDPIKAVQRALSVLRALNDLRCASVGDIHRRTASPSRRSCVCWRP